jgi:8-oxo-dGTP pyrophosphatase MutT (NUDIX family)
VDPKETLETAALRELQEECGISIEEAKLNGQSVYSLNGKQAEVSPLCLFESTTGSKFPVLPSTSHLIVFFLVKV